MDDLKSIRKRAEAIGLPFYTWAKLSSEPGSKVASAADFQLAERHAAEHGEGQAVDESAGQQVEALCAADTLKLDLTDADNVRIAIARLEEKHAPNTATAPWQFRGAVAAFDAGNDSTSSASGILAGATSETICESRESGHETPLEK